jgi:hypothetical protein
MQASEPHKCSCGLGHRTPRECYEAMSNMSDPKSHPIIRIREALGLDYPANTEEIVWRIKKIMSELARLLVERDQAVADLKHFQESRHLGDKAEKP